MSDEEIKIAIAETQHFTKVEESNGAVYFFRDGAFRGEADALPDYANDRNAMAEAENALFPDQWERYGRELEKLVVSEEETAWAIIKFQLIHATARQRAEAFLRTIGKWKE